jgi:hypothetical protein
MPNTSYWDDYGLQLERFFNEVLQWAEANRRAWGDDWYRSWRDWVEKQRRAAHGHIDANKRQLDDYERQAAAAGYKVTYR